MLVWKRSHTYVLVAVAGCQLYAAAATSAQNGSVTGWLANGKANNIALQMTSQTDRNVGHCCWPVCYAVIAVATERDIVVTHEKGVHSSDSHVCMCDPTAAARSA
jgi:hypothetical protein